MNKNRLICLVACKRRKLLVLSFFCLRSSHAVIKRNKLKNGPEPAMSALARSDAAPSMLTYAGTKNMNPKLTNFSIIPRPSQPYAA